VAVRQVSGGRKKLTEATKVRDNLQTQWIGAVVLTLVCVVGRLMPHAPNFTPMAAVALFGGMFFVRARVAACVSIAAMLASDAVIGFYDPRLMAVVYATLLFPICLRRFLRGRWSAVPVGLCSASGSIVFFVVTNFAVWLFGLDYAPTLGGLVRCYTAGLAFFQYTICGDLCWSAVLFGGYALARAMAHNGRSLALAGRDVSLAPSVR
jgi:hypothetical protein